MANFPSPLVLVEEFHLTYGHKIRITPAFNIKEQDLRLELIKEEVEELEEAEANKDFIEVIDALADIIYVTYGAALAHGLNIDAQLNESNHAVSPGQAFKILAPTLPATPTYNEESLKTYVPIIASSFEAYRKSIEDQNAVAATKALTEIVYNCFILSWTLGVNLDAILAEVQRSNMSKLGEDGAPILREDGKILKGPNFFAPNILKELEKQGYAA